MNQLQKATMALRRQLDRLEVLVESGGGRRRNKRASHRVKRIGKKKK